MSNQRNSSSRNNNVSNCKGKSYHFFSVPPDPPLLTGELFLIRESTITKIYFTLYDEDFLYYQNEKRTSFLGKIHFDFDLKIQWIVKQQKEKNANKVLNIFKISGFRLIVNDYFEEFQSSDDIMLQELKEIIRKKLNQCNFHEYYKAIKKIGKGNFASVYLVEHKETEKKYAVKAFSKDIVLKEHKGKESIFNEINIMRKLNHPNIIHLYEVHETENTIYMIMDYLEGGQLLDIFRTNRKIPEGEIVKMLINILNGITYLHENNIMHRDIKPENILFNNSTENKEPVIVDLGLATSEDEQEYLYPRCGTPGYVAPEIINIKSHKSKYSNACDIFSAGVIFHLFLLGKSPFSGKGYNDILTQNKNCMINFDKPDYKTLRYDCLDLLKKMLEKDPDKRISAKDCLNHCFLNRSSNAQFCEIDEALGMPVCNTLKKHNEEKKLDLDKINVFLISPSKSPVNHNNRSSHLFKGTTKSKETILVNENGTSKGSLNGLNASDSCISFVMRSPIFGGSDSVEEMGSAGNQKIKINTHDNIEFTQKKQRLIQRNNSHFNTIMSKMSECNMDEVSQKKNGEKNKK